MNNFKELQLLGEQEYQGEREERVRHTINGTLDTFRFLGQIVEMYLPRMVDTLVVIAGGEEGEEDDPAADKIDGSLLGPAGPGES